jgi:hypothetical protein
MKYLISLLCMLCFMATASAAPPTRESIEKLLSVAEVAKLTSSMQQQVDGLLKNTIAQATRGEQVTPEEQAILDDYRKKSGEILNDAISFDNLKGMFIQVYGESFTQDEINQLIAFYESPTGKMFISKMPVVMQKTMGQMQQLMAPMMQKIQQAAKEMQAQLAALKQKQAK